MKWTYKVINKEKVRVYDHNSDEVLTIENPNAPTLVRQRGTLIEPDIVGEICDYICNKIELSDFSSDNEMQKYVHTTQTILAAGKIEEIGR